MSDTAPIAGAQVAVQPQSVIRLEQSTVATTRPAQAEWGSDLVVDMLDRLGFEFIALNPGASYRGLHDSLVNYAGNSRPGMIVCNHEEIAVAVAHGYFKATGRPMAAAIHTNIGLLHSSMAIFNAYVDRVPVFIMAGTGPMDATRRRPGVDWTHTSNGLGSVVRDFIKWEHQPSSVAAIPEAMLRAYHLAFTEPYGPVLLTLDAGLQEQAIEKVPVLPDLSRYPLPDPIEPPREAVRTAGRWLLDADDPVIMLGQSGQTQEAWDQLIELAELLAASVISDYKSMASFPTDHYLQQASVGRFGRRESNETLASADVVLALDRYATAGTLRSATSRKTSHYESQSLDEIVGQSSQKLINVTLDHFAVRSWSTEYQELPAADLAIQASVERTVAVLLEEVRRLLADEPAAQRRVEQRTEARKARRAKLEAAWQAYAMERWEVEPGSIERVVGELRSAFGADYEQVMVSHIPNTWPSGIWEFTRPGSYLGKDGGGGLGSGIPMAVGASIGVQGSGRPVVCFLGDGDTLYTPSALWTAAHHRVPVLFVVANNASYYNDEEHQAHIARARNRPPENRWVGQQIGDPPVDFAGLARSLGVEAHGPIARPADLAGAYAQALRTLRRGEPVLVDARIREQ